MKPNARLKLFIGCLLCLALTSALSASPLAPKWPSTLNFQSLNEVQPPTTEAGWQFEASKLDMAIHSTHIAGLRARNSDMCLLKYMLLNYVIITDTDQLNELQSFAAANGYDFESAFLHYYDNTTATGNGQSFTVPGYGGGSATSLSQARVKSYIWADWSWVYNPKSPLVRKFLGYYYRKQMTTGNKPDGIFVDFIMPVNYYIPPASSGGRVIEYGNKKQSEIKTEYRNDIADVFAEVNTIMGNDSVFGDRYLLPNIGYINQDESVGFSADGILTEFWIQEVQNTIEYSYDLAKRIAAAGKILIYSQGTAGPMVPSAGNYKNADDRHQMYALTNYWIAKQGNSTYYQQKAPDGYPLLSSFWCKAREFDVGTPIDPLYSVWKTGTDSANQNYTIYKREYTKALMLSRPKVGYTYSDYSTPSQTYDLGGSYKLLHSDGTLGPTITNIKLAMGEAVTLLKVDGITPPDTTPPVISNVAATSITSSAATITWTTNEVAVQSLEYGTSTSYGTTVPASSTQTSQSITLTGLSPDTTYHCRITATDPASLKTVSGDYTFKTAQGGVLPAPHFPSTLNYQALNVIPPPQSEAEWQFEMAHLDMAYASSHLEGLRARGTDTYLLRYMLLHYLPIGDTAAYADLQNFATSRGFDVEDAFLHFYENTVVRYLDGQTESIPGWGGGSAPSRQAARVKILGAGITSWVYNLKSPLMQAYLGDLCRRTVTTGHKPNGIYVDGAKPLTDLIVTNSGGKIVEYGNRTAANAADDYLADAAAAYAAANNAMGQDDPLGDHFLLPDVCSYIEKFAGLGTTGSDGLIAGYNMQENQNLSPRLYDLAKQFGDAGKILVLTQGQAAPVVTSAPSNYNSDEDRHSMYCLSEYWMAKQGNSTYYSQVAPGNVPLSGFWCKAREADIGTPVDALYSVWKTGTDAAGQEFTIYKREYTKALVLSRPKKGWTYNDYKTQSPKYDLGGTYRLLHSDGTLGPEITSIGLAMGEAVTLVKPSAPATGTPQITVSITVDKTTAKVGEQLNYTVTYSNEGDGPAMSAVVTADVDSRVTFVSATNGGVYDSNARVVRWNVGTVPPGTTATARYTVTVN